ncbi:metallophosphoesterase family protein [Archaeoglobus neptunius]|uniref:metallophosphoesterase family protein n=1 Tax=Archaeoglobus neptunius TaxID=2798580 RepID=UPI001927D780|nr:metallophosphoesterase family protein [Archaeoglobus neptunius]
MRLYRDSLFIGRKAVISDLHLGLLRFYDRSLIERAKDVAEKAETLIVAGDLRHMGKRGRHEDFINEVGEITELILIRGNHDIGIKAEKSIRIGKYGIFHGHAVPDEDVWDARYLIFGHAHPAVFLRDSVGGYRERVFLSGEIEDNKRVVVLPAFNDLCASTAVNLDRPAGFMFRRYDYKKWNVILLDGTILSID